MPDSVVVDIMRASGFSLAFSGVNRRVYGLTTTTPGFGRHWVHAMLRTRKASKRRVAATDFYLQRLPPHMRRLNVHRLVEIVARGTRDGASARLVGLAAAVVRACESEYDDAYAHAAMLTRAGCLMDIAYDRVLNFQGSMLHRQGGLAAAVRDPTGRGALDHVRCFMREREAPCERPYRCAASQRKMREGDAGLSWALVHETIKLMLAKLEPSIVRTIREERIGDAHVYTDEALVEAARCNIGMYVPTPKRSMSKHILRVLVLAYMHPELRPEVLRRWGPLSFFATSSVKSLSELFSAPAGVRAARMHGTYETGSGIESLLARATREDVAEASTRLPLFRGDLMWDTGKVRRMRAFACAELGGRVGHWDVPRVTTRRACWTTPATETVTAAHL
jgi:hypothetical protein